MGKASRRKQVRITSQAEADGRAGILVCTRAKHYADDQVATCLRCGTTVYHRPHAPKPKEGYYCLECALPLMRHHDSELLATTTSMKELLLDIMTEAQTRRH